ncbi:hypothetical protein AVEN_251924-1 [Araneus ventricosus]|uniref:Peptidase S1 domain-containing protein n=1 Tax=Araneus ventricosus TaxID=182803 RepID=A0A4Y2H123_ARAVE|nr:hypothetical protein AVEN_251924-1 [Araneus ventricosus]
MYVDLVLIRCAMSEGKDLEADAFAVTDSDLKGYVGAFDDDGHEIDVDDLQSDDHVKRYANETVDIAGHGRINRSWYRSKRMRKPEEDEDVSISEYYKKRRRPDNEDEDGSRKDGNERRRPDYDDEDGSITDDNDRRRRSDYDEGRRRPNDKRRRRNRKNFGGNCQTCGNMLGGKRGKSRYFERVINGRPVQPVFKYPWIDCWSTEGGVLVVTTDHGRTPSEGGTYYHPYHYSPQGSDSSLTYTPASHIRVLTMPPVGRGGCPQKEQQPQCKMEGVMPKFCYFKPNEITLNLLGQRQEDKQRPVRIAQLIPHDQFDYAKVLHDIALIKLAAPIQCNQLSSPICLPTTDLQKLGGQLIVAGWGYNTGEGQRIQSISQYLSVHKDSFRNPPTDRHLENAVVGD